MSTIPKGWWRDELRSGVAHFYDAAEAEVSPILIAWPKCRLSDKDEPMKYLGLPEEEEARPFVDMGECPGKACGECLRLLEGDRGAGRGSK